MRETERGENAMNVIVAVDENWGIGKDGDQLVYLSQDLKRFKALTTGHPVILGRKTLATFPGGRPLKGRRNLILSRDPAFAQEGAEVFRDLEALRSAYRRTPLLSAAPRLRAAAALVRYGVRHQDPRRLSGGRRVPQSGPGSRLGTGGGGAAPGAGWPVLPLCALPADTLTVAPASGETS